MARTPGFFARRASYTESNVAFRLNAATSEKAAIAQVARTMVEPGMSVLLDDSTTTLAVAEAPRGTAA